MSNLTTLAQDNIDYLQQASDLVGALSDAEYLNAAPATYGSGIGAHLRHCLDHYTNFLAGLDCARIDYDARQRDVRVEQDRGFALSCMESLRARLAGLRDRGQDAALEVKMDCGDQTDPATWWSRSSVCRELQFLISHTVHHYALIAFMLRQQGRDPGPRFGVAPSTIRYNESKASCVR